MRMWYVIQVIKGREDAMATLIGRVVPRTVLEECFSPKFATEIKLRGQWTPCAKELFPGYLIAVTDDPVELESRLAQMDEFARVLMQGETYAPLLDPPPAPEEDLLRRVLKLAMEREEIVSILTAEDTYTGKVLHLDDLRANVEVLDFFGAPDGQRQFPLRDMQVVALDTQEERMFRRLSDERLKLL